MTTLHDRLEAAVRARLSVAREASRDLTPSDWYSVSDLANDHSQGGAGLTDFDAEFIAANSPDRIIRGCERDLKVLARHAAVDPYGYGDPGRHCKTCRTNIGPVRHPCNEIRDLAEEYGITEVSDGGEST